MAASSLWRWGAGTLALAILAASVVWWTRTSESDAEQSPPAAVPPIGLAVALTRPGGAHAPAVVGMEAWLDVEVVATQRVTGLELWSEGQLVASEELPLLARDTRLRRRLTFVPDELGIQTVVARAVDAAGRVGQSPPLRLAVSEPYLPAVMTTVEVQEGEGLEDLAARTGADPEVLLTVNPSLPADGEWPAGLFVDVPVLEPSLDGPLPPEAIPPELRDLPTDVDAGPPSDPSDRPPRGTPVAPVGPGIEVTVADCEMTVQASDVDDEANGVAIHLLGPRDQQFTIVASIEAGEAWTAPVAPGEHTVAVSEFTEDGHHWSAPTDVAVPDACGGEHTGEVRLEDGLLSGGAEADFGYVYLSVDGGTWQRVPEDPHVFVPRTADHFDLSDHLPALEGSELEIDAWGWRGAELVHLGTGAVTAPIGVDLNALVGMSQKVSLWWVEDPGGRELLRPRVQVEEPQELTFSWSTVLPEVTGATWQVTGSPADPELIEPTDVLAKGDLEGTGGPFSIDFSRLHPRPGRWPGVSPSPEETELVVDLGPERYYVRVVPYAGDRFVGAASAPLPVAVGKSVAQLADELDIGDREFNMTLEVVPPRAPNLWRSDCFQLAGWDHEKVDSRGYAAALRATSLTELLHEPNGFGYYLYFAIIDQFGPNIPLCAGSCYETAVGNISLAGDGCDRGSPLKQLGEGLAELVEMAWDNGIVFVFSELKAFVVETLAEFSGCNTMVGALGASEEDATKWCEAAANAVVSAVMAAYGIPPTLPTSSDLIDAAKGDLAALAVEYAKSVGIPCDEVEDVSTAGELAGEDIPTCEELARQLLDEFQDALNDQFRAQAAAYGVVFPPGAIVVPHPDGQVTPAIVRIGVEPTPLPLEACPISILSHSSWTPDTLVPAPASAEEQAAQAMKQLFSVESGDPEPTQWMVEAEVPWAVRYPTDLPPAPVEGQPFTGLFRDLPVQGEEVVLGGSLLESDEVVTGAELRLFESGWFPPASVVYERRQFSSSAQSGPSSRTVWTPFDIPYHSLLLHRGAEFTVSVLSSCAGVVTQTVTVPDVPNRVGLGQVGR
ncbi:MAG: hypothetical protein R3320_05710 [Nitriliruptorales bacterium]|nr:hypothetical protein [Nitriliruptorales bacterium]